MTDGPEPKRLRLSKTELGEMSKENLIEQWVRQDNYVDLLESKASDGQKENSELVSLRESEEKLKQQQVEATRRENVLVMRLTTKEQEMQDYANQIQELKQAQVPGTSQLRSSLLDPAVNLMFERMKKGLDSTKAKLEETQNDLSAWKFTPDSNTGKRLMAKCRLLHQENEELGKMISSGRVAKLEGDLALQRNFSEEMKKSQADLDEFLMELDEDVEGMQSTIYYLQQQLREAKDTVSKLQLENGRLKECAPAIEDSVNQKVALPVESSDEAASERQVELNHGNVKPCDQNEAMDTVEPIESEKATPLSPCPLSRAPNALQLVSSCPDAVEVKESKSPCPSSDREMNSSPVLEIDMSFDPSSAEVNEWRSRTPSPEFRTNREELDDSTTVVQRQDAGVDISNDSLSNSSEPRLEIDCVGANDLVIADNINGHDAEMSSEVEVVLEAEDSRQSLTLETNSRDAYTPPISSTVHKEDSDTTVPCGGTPPPPKDTTVDASSDAPQLIKKAVVNGLSDSVVAVGD